MIQAAGGDISELLLISANILAYIKSAPDNLSILVSHVECAAFELPFIDGEKFGRAEKSSHGYSFIPILEGMILNHKINLKDSGIEKIGIVDFIKSLFSRAAFPPP